MNRSTDHTKKLLTAALTIGLSFGALALTTTSAHAARFSVRVVDEIGQPVPGASVCIGLHGNYRQFGTAFTDASGMAGVVDVPNVPFVVTISKTRFAAIRVEQPSTGYDLVREFTLGGGLPGPRCKAGSTVAANPPLIRIDDVGVISSNGSTSLRLAVTGNPNHYRIGFDEDMDFAKWLDFEETVTIPAAFADASELYLQMRRFVGTPESNLESVSDVVLVKMPGAAMPN